MLQISEQQFHRPQLLFSACVSWITVLVQSALVANTNGMAVVIAAMSANIALRSSLMHCAVARNVIVISDVSESTVLTMVAPALLKAQTTPHWSSRAMQND